MDRPPTSLARRVERVLGRVPVAWRKATGGHTVAERWIVSFEDGSSCFVKSGGGSIGDFLRVEYDLVYSRLEKPFLARLLAWGDDGETPVLVLEDLSHADWPPPWDDAKVEAVLETLSDVRDLDLPGLPSIDLQKEQLLYSGWQRLREDPTPFLRLGLASAQWLDTCLEPLIRQAEAAEIEGTDMLHLDVRSDNLCFVDGRAVLVD